MVALFTRYSVTSLLKTSMGTNMYFTPLVEVLQATADKNPQIKLIPAVSVKYFAAVHLPGVSRAYFSGTRHRLTPTVPSGGADFLDKTLPQSIFSVSSRPDMFLFI